ncbi:uncharacterized protein RJT20DRAFT_65932 [Scheffersomyces xylosifermentans]|uniref:uncharacterized protein n=1 Tax=Scheffersomyces xylosifermentans TaxID=1304137 RepID=UPI00315D6B34
MQIITICLVFQTAASLVAALADTPLDIFKRASIGSLTGTDCNQACTDTAKQIEKGCSDASDVNCLCKLDSKFWDTYASCACGGQSISTSGSALKSLFCDNGSLNGFSDLGISDATDAETETGKGGKTTSTKTKGDTTSNNGAATLSGGTLLCLFAIYLL